MRSLLSVLAGAGLATVAAASDKFGTSPFIVFSTSEILTPSPPRIATSEAVSSLIEHELAKCPTDIYVVAQQRGVSQEDYMGPAGPGTTTAFPAIRRFLLGEDRRIRSSFSVPQVVGSVDPVRIRDVLQDRCGAGSMHLDARLGTFDLADEARPRVIMLSLDDLPAGSTNDRERKEKAHTNDMYLATMLDMLPTNNFTVIYTTAATADDDESGATNRGGSDRAKGAVKGSTGEGEADGEEGSDLQYEMDHADGFVHMELRRDVHGDIAPRATGHKGENNRSLPGPNAPLFEQYQFFTPALFMGFVTAAMLLSILYFAVSAVAGMEVTYAAFDKENGPAAQQKKQQ